MKRILIVVLLLAVVGAGSGWYLRSSNASPVSFRTAVVERGDLLATIGATGTIEPEEVIDVGAQVAGKILSFGDDPRSSGKAIDYSSPVEKGTVLARIDDALYVTQVDRAKATVGQARANLDQSIAQVAQANANIQRAMADLEQMKAKVEQADRDWHRARRLRITGAAPNSDYDAADATLQTARATAKVGAATIDQMKAAKADSEANVAKSKATLADAVAALKNAEINLSYCTITSPVKGVIIDRRVNIGQTVVSSLNAPSLFLIAKDLTRLQVWCSVNEADVGNIYSGQSVTFTVDAHPGRTFLGVVAPDQPRLNASMTQNVVTYTVVINTDNSDRKLVPYLTANVRFEVSRRNNVLQVPNVALRWKPRPDQVVPDARQEYTSSLRRGKDTDGKPDPRAEREPHDQRTVWVQEGDLLRPVTVKIGLSDGVNTEIVNGAIEEGASIVVGENRSAGGGAKNPFAPKMFGGKKQ